jgi:outer membrane biogenesis lipoprotein LolB
VRVARVLLLTCVAALGCHRAPPTSRFPDARALLTHLERQQSCSRGLAGEGKIDYFGKEGRVRGSLMFMVARPDSVRLDVISPFGATLSTLTSDGSNFSLLDLRQKVFLRGPASACNLAQFTRVPLPPHALVSLLGGQPPVLAHDASAASLAWESGRYVVRIAGEHLATEELTFSVGDADYDKPYGAQQVLLSSVEVRQKNYVLYRAELAAHEAASTAPPRVDPDGLEPDMPPSGPDCRAVLPRRLRLEVPAEEQDLLLAIDEISHNPPHQPGVFQQRPPGGVVVRSSLCQ